MRGHVLGAITALNITYPVQAQGDFIPGRWHPSTFTSASFALAPDRAELLSMSTAIGTGNALVTTTLWKVRGRLGVEIVRCIDWIDAGKPDSVFVERCYIGLMGK